MDTAKQLAKSEKNSLQNYAQRLTQKMAPEEAMKGVIRMLSAYPETGSKQSRDYLMSLAETLCQFPLEVATKACSPVHGVPKEFKSFPPTAGQVNDWCAREGEWLRRMADRFNRFALPPPFEQPATQEERAAHVRRVLGELAARKTDDSKSWFDRMTAESAQAFLDANETP